MIAACKGAGLALLLQIASEALKGRVFEVSQADLQKVQLVSYSLQ